MLPTMKSVVGDGSGSPARCACEHRATRPPPPAGSRRHDLERPARERQPERARPEAGARRQLLHARGHAPRRALPRPIDSRHGVAGRTTPPRSQEARAVAQTQIVRLPTIRADGLQRAASCRLLEAQRSRLWTQLSQRCTGAAARPAAARARPAGRSALRGGSRISRRCSRNCGSWARHSLGVNRQQLCHVLVGDVQAVRVDALAADRRHQPDRGLVRGAVAGAAREHPREHARVLAEARPQEAPAVVLAEPVDVEDLRQLARRACAPISSQWAK